MRKIDASEFKEQCLTLLHNLEPDGVLITEHGKPVAWLMPAGSDCAELIGSMKGEIHVRGDILSTGRVWDPES